jgi:hypothetical protein
VETTPLQVYEDMHIFHPYESALQHDERQPTFEEHVCPMFSLVIRVGLKYDVVATVTAGATINHYFKVILKIILGSKHALV